MTQTYQKSLTLAEAHVLLAETIIKMNAAGVTGYLFGIAYFEESIYVIALPYADENLKANAMPGPNHMCAKTAHFVDSNHTVGKKINAKDFRLMAEGNRWEWFVPTAEKGDGKTDNR